MFVGPIEEKRFVDVEENAVYWYFVVLAWLPIYGVIYWAPRLICSGTPRWLSPLPLWAGFSPARSRGPFDLIVSYALVKWTCASAHPAAAALIALRRADRSS